MAEIPVCLQGMLGKRDPSTAAGLSREAQKAILAQDDK
jgi:hypothetical protein